MAEFPYLELFDAAMAALSAAGLAYMLQSGRFTVAYAGFLRALSVGLLAFSLVATTLAVLPGDLPGGGLVGLFVLPSLYVLVRSEVALDRGSESLESVFELRRDR